MQPFIRSHRPMRTLIFRHLALALLLSAVFTTTAQAKLTLGLVPTDEGVFATKAEAWKLARYLTQQIGDPVLVKSFNNEEVLYDWIATYQLLDLAIFSPAFYAQKPDGASRYLADLVKPGTTPYGQRGGTLAARQGLQATQIHDLSRALFHMSDENHGRSVLQAIGLARVDPPGGVSIRPNQKHLRAKSDRLPAERSGAVSLNPQPAQERAASDKGGGQMSWTLEPIDQHIYAALARPQGPARSNAFFIIGQNEVLVGGAHMTSQALEDLITAIAEVTEQPLRTFVLAHHHPASPETDAEFPPGIEVVMSRQTQQALAEDLQSLPYRAVTYKGQLHLQVGGVDIVLTEVGKGHTSGDTLVHLPKAGMVFTSDLVHVHGVGDLKDGYMLDWVVALEYLEGLEAKTVIPGYGQVSGPEAVTLYKNYLRYFLMVVLDHIEAEENLEETISGFSLPEYRNYAGYDRLLRPNIRRAYTDLKENVLQN